jgi:hypothetical protein
LKEQNPLSEEAKEFNWLLISRLKEKLTAAYDFKQHLQLITLSISFCLRNPELTLYSIPVLLYKIQQDLFNAWQDPINNNRTQQADRCYESEKSRLTLTIQQKNKKMELFKKEAALDDGNTLNNLFHSNTSFALEKKVI